MWSGEFAQSTGSVKTIKAKNDECTLTVKSYISLCNGVDFSQSVSVFSVDTIIHLCVCAPIAQIELIAKRRNFS